MRLLRILALLCAVHSISLRAKHLPGVNNTTADALSRNNFAYIFCFQPTGCTSSYRSAPMSSGAYPGSQTALDVLQLEAALPRNCIAPATRTSYATAQHRYLSSRYE